MFEASHVERVIRHLVRFGSSRADAEDLAQEVLVIAWRKQGELDRDRSLDAWLYGIARNVYRNHARSQRRKPMTDELTPATVTAAAPATDARDLAEVVTFRDALGALPEAQQDIVILHELEEYTLKETAELLAIPFDTAKDRLRRAREQLREHMHADLAAVAANERRTTSQLAKAAAPAVLVGVLAAVSRSAAAAGAGAAAGASAAGAASATGGSAASTLTGAAFASKLVLGGVLAAGIALGVLADRVITRGTPPAASAGLASTELPAEPVVRALPDAAVPDAAPAADADAALHPGGSATAAAGAATSPEAQLIERARVALRRGTPDEALRTLMSHERRFPAGQLAEERDILLVEAYVAAGNLTLARERLEHYNATYPNGLHKQRAADAAREIEQRLPR